MPLAARRDCTDGTDGVQGCCAAAGPSTGGTWQAEAFGLISSAPRPTSRSRCVRSDRPPQTNDVALAALIGGFSPDFRHGLFGDSPVQAETEPAATVISAANGAWPTHRCESTCLVKYCRADGHGADRRTKIRRRDTIHRAHRVVTSPDGELNALSYIWPATDRLAVAAIAVPQYSRRPPSAGGARRAVAGMTLTVTMHSMCQAFDHLAYRSTDERAAIRAPESTH